MPKLPHFATRHLHLFQRPPRHFSQRSSQRLPQRTPQRTPAPQELRGDTVVEVMFAIAIFSLVAVISIAMMNAGIAGGERSLELTTARAEINAQAEALRFIHSSYAAELTLPECSSTSDTENCQQFRNIWRNIIARAIGADDFATNFDKFQHLAELSPSANPTDNACTEIYSRDLLTKANAFILNTREMSNVNSTTDTNKKVLYLASDKESITNRPIFQAAPLGARLIYSQNGRYTETSASSVKDLQTDPSKYRRLARAEGIWIIGVASKQANSSGAPDYYDFYIQSCWYGSNANAPTTLDSTIRLYNPDGLGV